MANIAKKAKNTKNKNTINAGNVKVSKNAENVKVAKNAKNAENTGFAKNIKNAKKKKIIVVGGGASGIFAALFAAQNGGDVLLMEGNDRLGKKLAATGNGRCNYTNLYMQESCYRGKNSKIISDVLATMPPESLIRLFADMGMASRSREGYIYPYSDEAKSVVEILTDELLHAGVKIAYEKKVERITCRENKYLLFADGEQYTADKVILSTGSMAAPKTGSDGSGYRFAEILGHKIVPVVPALTGVRCKGKEFKDLSGVRTDAAVKVYVNGKFTAMDVGEVQLTNYGISGIPVFQVSRYVAYGLAEKKDVRISLDFTVNLQKEYGKSGQEDLLAILKGRRKILHYKNVEDFLTGLFHKKLNIVLLKNSHINLKKKVRDISDTELEKLLRLMTDYKVSPASVNKYDQAQLTAGGVDTGQINSKTMESKKVPGLYITGELLDVDGICGGYNLHFAFSTGRLAGISAAR